MIILQDRYTLMDVVAEGGENVVYLAKDTHTEERVILKRTKNGLAPEDRSTWQRETLLLKQLHIDTVAKVYDTFIHVSEMVAYGYVVQQYIEGETLDKEFQRKRYTSTEVLTIIQDILSIVCQLQEFSPPILHRDIKPSNIIRRQKDDTLILLDFGLATEQQDRDFGHTVGVGTLGFQSPEQLFGQPTLNTDVYSVGVIALQFLTRKEPQSLLWGNILKWESSAQFLHKDWKNWLTKTLAPTEERFRDAEDALNVLLQNDFGRKVQATTSQDMSHNAAATREVHRSNNLHKKTPHSSNAGTKSQHTPQKNLWDTTAPQHPPLQNPNRYPTAQDEELQKTKQMLVASGCSFFFLGFFAIPFIVYFYNKKKRLETHR